MEWWAWITVGAILLGSELTFVNAQFYLVFIGGAALLVGVPGSRWGTARRLAAMGAVRGACRGFAGGVSAAGLRAHALETCRR